MPYVSVVTSSASIRLKLIQIGASSRSAGKKYKDAVRWKQAKAMSTELAELEVRECKASNFTDCDLVFSGLDSDVAGEIGKLFMSHCSDEI